MALPFGFAFHGDAVQGVLPDRAAVVALAQGPAFAAEDAAERTIDPDDLVSPAAGARYGDRAGPRPVVSHVASKHGLKTGLHNRRHTHAMLLMQNQVPIKMVTSRLGHADPAMTLGVYQHVTE